MFWRHETSKDWLEARKYYLNASNIADLMPYTPTGRKRTITDLDRMKLWVAKQNMITDDEVVSTGMAARGHILEPFAIDAYNECYRDRGAELSHWDDVVITDGVCAFSPDALDVKNIYDSSVVKLGYTDMCLDNCHELGEVKCYNAERHIETAYTDKMQLKERWQIAMAMHVVPQIKIGRLILFNPGLPIEYRLFVHRYDRTELVDELAAIEKVALEWMDFCDSGVEAFTTPTLVMGPESEERIVSILEEESKIDPIMKGM